MLLTKFPMRTSLLATMFATGWFLSGATPTGAQPNQPPTESIEKLQRLIAPAPGESQWMQVPWMPSSNIYAARKKAAEEGKPLLLWYMAGEPLGTC